MERADGKWLATTGNDGRVVLWDAATGEESVELETLASGRSTGLALTPDSRPLAWDPASGTNVLCVSAETTVYATAFSPDGTRLAMVPLDGTVVLLDSVPAARRLAR